MDKIKRAAHRAEFYQQNKERLVADQKKYNQAHYQEMRDYQRVYYRLKCYGLTKEDFDRMITSQNNKCGICEVVFNLKDKKISPHVDHNHSTGKVRKLLCMKCNCGMGSFNDDPSLLKKAAEYLQLFQ